MRELRTERLRMRPWQADDASAMARINEHHQVGRFLNRPVDAVAIASFYGAMVDHWHRHGFGPWALESLEAEMPGRFIGFAGLAHVPPYLSATASSPELGWRLDPEVWGRGLATEAAAAARDDAFAHLHLPEVISIIHPENARSRRIAEKLGMSRDRQILNPVLGIEVDVWQLSNTVHVEA